MRSSPPTPPITPPSPLSPWTPREVALCVGLAAALTLAGFIGLRAGAGPLELRTAIYSFFASPLVHLAALGVAAALVGASGALLRRARLLRCAGLVLGGAVVLAAATHLTLLR